MGKGLDFIVIILIWGGLLGLLFYIFPTSDFIGSSFLASSLSAISDSLNSQKDIIGMFDNKGNFQETTVHFNKSVDIFDIKIFPNNPDLIFAASNRGLFISRDAGLNWYNFSDIERKINARAKVYKILFTPSGLAFASVFQNNKGVIYESEDNFFSLKKILELDDEAVYDFDIFNSNLYLGLSDGRLLLYSLANKEFRVLTSFNSSITNLKIGQTNGLIYLTLKSGGLFVSSNSGQSFSRLKFLDGYRGANKIQTFQIDPRNNALIYAATDYGLLRSLDSGNTWQVFKSLPAEKPKISALAFQSKSGELYASSNGKIYKSGDSGLNWQILEPRISDRKVSIITLNGDKIIVGTKK